MTPEEEAYKLAEERIAEAKAGGWKFLNIGGVGYEAEYREEKRPGFEELRHLTRIPTRISDLNTLERLDIDSTSIFNLAPILGLTRLQMLAIDNTPVSDITSIQSLTALQTLWLDGTQVSDLTPMQGLSGLRTLFLNNTLVSDLTPIQGLSGLLSLHLNSTQVSDLTPIQGLSGLLLLSLDSTQVSDLAPMQGLSDLQELSINSTQVSDLTPIQGLSDLQELSINSTQVSDLAPIQGLSGLQSLSLNNTQVSDLAPIQGLSGLQSLSLNNTQVSDLAPIQGLSGLQSLSLNNTQVGELAPIQGLSGLQSLSLNNTQVSDLAPIQGLTELRELYLYGTPLLQNEPALQKICEDYEGAELVRKILERQRENGKLPKKPEAALDDPPIFSIHDISQDPGGWRYDISASQPALIVETASASPPDAATQLLPRLQKRVAEAQGAYAEGSDHPVPLIRDDLSEVARIVSGTMDSVAAEAIILWELSIGLAHYLDEDTAAVQAMANRPTLSVVQRGVLTRLITASAGFIRMFPDVVAMDDSLSNWARTAHDRHLAPTMIEVARDKNVLERHSAELILKLARMAQQLGPDEETGSAQVEKADAVTVKGQRNLLGIVAGAALHVTVGAGAAYGVGFFGDAGADLNKETQFGIHAAHFLMDARDEVVEFVKDAPADLKTSVEEAIRVVTDPDLPPLPPIKPLAEIPIPAAKPT